MITIEKIDLTLRFNNSSAEKTVLDYVKGGIRGINKVMMVKIIRQELSISLGDAVYLYDRGIWNWVNQAVDTLSFNELPMHINSFGMFKKSVIERLKKGT